MKASNALWRSRLLDQMPQDLAAEIDDFERDMLLRKQGKLDERVFAEIRLRRGCYGQRYDNGRRFDGLQTRRLHYPSGELTKGPQTLWDAPGMQRIKIPYGGLTARQLEVVAELAEEYSVGVAHITTRQDFQLHFVHIEDTPTIMRRLAVVGITTREACGNTVRNVTACPMAGVCAGERFDVTPHADALFRFLLGHPDTQAFGRKFKIAFSGCPDRPCGLARMHDIGLIAAVRAEDGRTRQGFRVYVGGGLGPVPQQARLFEEFLPAEELLPVAQAIARVFARLGEKKNRNTARMKFLVSKLGIAEFRRLVWEERSGLPEDPRWTAHLKSAAHAEAPLKPASLLEIDADGAEGFAAWRACNVQPQRQPGYSAVTIPLPLGDITAAQLRALAAIARRYVRDTIRATQEQNLLLRWVSNADLPALYAELQAVGLAEPCAGTIADVVACPGSDTCKLGIASSRGLARELRGRLLRADGACAEAARDLRIKISGCFNSCGQHHVADIGFYGVGRRKGLRVVPHFQLLLGGRQNQNAAAFGVPIGAIPSRRIPEALERILRRYAAERLPGEEFSAYVARVGRGTLKAALEDLLELPPYDAAPALYRDWGDPREFTLGDLGAGECAGEVVPPIEFELAACERELFEAQLQLDQGRPAEAARRARQAMLHGAAALLRHAGVPCGSGAAEIVEAFRRQLGQDARLAEAFLGGRFAAVLLEMPEDGSEPEDAEQTQQRIQQAHLFLQGCHDGYARLTETVAETQWQFR